MEKNSYIGDMKTRSRFDGVFSYLFKENKDNVISIRKIHIKDQNFEGITNVSRSVLSSINKGKSRPKLSTIVTFCISLMLDVIDS